MINEEEKSTIVQSLMQKMPRLECPMCHNHHFILADGYTMLGVQDVKEHVILGGNVMPVIGLVCSHCGFVSFHSLGVLDLLNKEDQSKNKTPN